MDLPKGENVKAEPRCFIFLTLFFNLKNIKSNAFNCLFERKNTPHKLGS